MCPRDNIHVCIQNGIDLPLDEINGKASCTLAAYIFLKQQCDHNLLS